MRIKFQANDEFNLIYDDIELVNVKNVANFKGYHRVIFNEDASGIITSKMIPKDIYSLREIEEE